MVKFKILGKSVKIEKKSNHEYFNFKVTLGREAFFFSKDNALGSNLSFGDKKYFLGEESPVTETETMEIREFAEFLIVFRAYEYTLSSRRDFSLGLETTETLTAKDAWKDSEETCYYNDFDYRKEVKLSSVDSLWGSQSNMHIFCQFVGHVTNEGGNQILEPYYLERNNYLYLGVEANSESLQKRLGVKELKPFDTNSQLVIMWFLYEILPTYFMLDGLKDMRNI